MISITDFNLLCEQIQQNIPEIYRRVTAAHEDHAVKKLKDTPGVILMAITPSARRSGAGDGGIDDNVTWLFILQKQPADLSSSAEEAMFDRLQKIILKVRDYIEELHSEGDARLFRYRPAEVQIDPEYLEFGGFSGWSMSVIF